MMISPDTFLRRHKTGKLIMTLFVLIYSINLTVKAPSKICSRRQLNFFLYFSEKTSLDISCELSDKQTIHMKCQDLFSLKNKKKK